MTNVAIISRIPTTSARSILDPHFQYVPAAQTDVTRTWRKHGWKEPDRRVQLHMRRLLNQITE